MTKRNCSSLLLLLIPVLILASCAPTWKTLESERDRVTEEIYGVNGLNNRLPLAFDEVSTRSGDYPQHYLTDQNVLGRLEAAQRNLDAITAPETGYLAVLNQAIEQRDKKAAKEALGQIDALTPEIKAISELILGPPERPQDGLYQILDMKVALLKDGYVSGDGKDLLAEVKALDAPTWASIQAASPFPLCGSNTQMSYSSARSSYGTAVTYLLEAERLNTVEVDGMIDLPAISDKLVQAKQSYDAADKAVDNAVDDHADAVEAIGLAEGAKKTAGDALCIECFLGIGQPYYYDEGKAQYDLGDEALTNANTSCKVDEDFVESLSNATLAKGYFEKALERALEPEPEDDPIIIIESDSDEDSPGIDISPCCESNDDDGGGIEFNDDGQDFEFTDDGQDFEYNDDGGDIESTDDGGL